MPGEMKKKKQPALEMLEPSRSKRKEVRTWGSLKRKYKESTSAS